MFGACSELYIQQVRNTLEVLCAFNLKNDNRLVIMRFLKKWPFHEHNDSSRSGFDHPNPPSFKLFRDTVFIL